MNSKILSSILAIGVALMMGVAGGIAVFSDTEKSEGNTFTAGALDLKIDLDDSRASYTDEVLSFEQKDLEPGDLFFNWMDVKPGDNGEATISVHVYDNPAHLWIGVDNLVDYEMGQTEPEMEVDDSGGDPGMDNGELSANIYVEIWEDDGNNQLDEGETVLENGWLRDMENGWYLGVIENCTTYYYAVSWEIPIEVGNEIQTDKVTFDVVFYAEQERNNPEPSWPVLIPE